MDVKEELKFFVKIQKKKLGGGGSGQVGSGRVGKFRVDVIEELKFFGKFTKISEGGVAGRGGGGLVGGGGGGGGVRVDVNAMLG